jgi:hypothetical protein
MTRYRVAFHSLAVDGPVLWPTRFRFAWTARVFCWILQRQCGKERWFYAYPCEISPYKCPQCGKRLVDVGGYWGCLCNKSATFKSKYTK